MNKVATGLAIASALLIGGVVHAQTTAPVAREGTTVQQTSLKGTWRSSKLIGLNVYNQADEKLGDINELLLDAEGRVKAVVIGVGGFLGMGEHDIAVTMDKLKFMETPHAKSAAADRKTTTGSTASTNDWAPDHAVMSATKDQLKAMPQFKYSDYN